MVHGLETLKKLNDEAINRLLQEEPPVLEIQDYQLTKWRDKVLERDCYMLDSEEPICVMCKRTNSFSSIHAHHIKPNSLYPQEKYDIVNGISLCPVCHIGIVHLGNSFLDITTNHNYRFFQPSFFDWTNSEKANQWHELVSL